MKWIKAFLLMAVVGAVFFVAGCKKSKTGSFQLQMQAVYGPHALAYNDDTFNSVTDPLGHYIQVSVLQFYLSHIYLVTNSNALVKVADVNFFDISNPSTLNINVADVPEGNYKGITFYCGVDSIMDTISPISATVPPALQAGSAIYWPILYYQFEHVEGKWDTAYLPILRGAFTYHVGTKPYYRHAYVSGNFSVGGGTTTQTLTLDFEKLFWYNASTELLDITQPLDGGYTQCTTGVAYESETASSFSDNWAQAFSLQ